MVSKMAMTGSGGNPQAASDFLAESLQMASARLEAFQSIGDIFGMDLSNIYNVTHTTPTLNLTDAVQKVRLPRALQPAPHVAWPARCRLPQCHGKSRFI